MGSIAQAVDLTRLGPGHQITPPTMSSLFKENSSQRFRRESQEMWEKIQTDEKMTNVIRDPSNIKLVPVSPRASPLKLEVNKDLDEGRKTQGDTGLNPVPVLVKEKPVKDVS